MKKILVPVDFSEVSEYALQFAVELAVEQGASIRLLNSAEAAYFREAQYQTFVDPKLMDTIHRSITDRLHRMIDDLGEVEVEIDAKVTVSDLLSSVKAEVKAKGIDLIVMGTRGSSGLEELLIGSNTERVVRHIDCPVISVPEPAALQDIKKILVPIDLKEIRISFLNEVAMLQKTFDAELEFIWVKTPHHIENEEMVAAEMKRIFDALDISNYCFAVVKNVFPSDGIYMEVEDTGADMVAMATHARRGISHWLSGSLTEDTVNHVHVPVWSFKIDKSEKVMHLDAIANAEGIPEYRRIEPLFI